MVIEQYATKSVAQLHASVTNNKNRRSMFENIGGDVLIQLSHMKVGDVLGPCRPVCSVKGNRNPCLADEALDHARLPLGNEVIYSSGTNEPHLDHATLDKVKDTLLERGHRATLTSLSSLPDLRFQLLVQ